MRRARCFHGLALVLAALAPVGCSSYDCEDYCEDVQDCPQFDDSYAANCSVTCGQMEDLVDAAGCPDAFDDYLDCIGDVDDICIMYEDAEDLAEMECYSEAMSYGVCIMAYCNVDSPPPECTSYYDED